MRFPRFTTRRLMVLVAVAALSLGMWADIEARRARLRQLAQYHRDRMTANAIVLVKGNHMSYHMPETPRERGIYLYHLDLWIKYDQASPWLPVPPDPPPPK